MQGGGRSLSTGLTALVNKDAGVVVDIRPSKDFAAGHIVGAVNIPQDKLAARMASWKNTRPRPSFWSMPGPDRRHSRSRADEIRLHRRQAVRWRFQLESRQPAAGEVI
jgi:hypothetical protein